MIALEQCLGAVQFIGGTDENCETQVPLTGFWPDQFSYYARNGTYIAYVPGGFNRKAGIWG